MRSLRRNGKKLVFQKSKSLRTFFGESEVLTVAGFAVVVLVMVWVCMRGCETGLHERSCSVFTQDDTACSCERHRSLGPI